MVYLPHWPIPATLGNRKIDYETVFERMALVLEKLGNPQEKLPLVIHVAGTNGKGSATSLISEIFTQASYKTHIYTSPHLHDCNERIVLAGEKISDNFLFEIMEETRIATAQTPLTFMESFTIAAFLAFSKIPADIAVIECGMGGRIDATNIIQKKLASVIMPISFDHTEYLGNSIERIALEKAMIMRPKTPLIVASQPKKAGEIIEILARDQNVKTYFYDEDFAVIMDEESGEFDFRFENKIFENLPRPALLGSHQYINFATAIAAVLAVKENFKIREKHIRQAISNVRWPSRLENISDKFTKIIKAEAWIDGAHNEAGAFALARFILEQNDDQENFVICGFSRGKCKKEFLEKFRNIAEVVAVRVDGEPYPESAEKISQIGAEINMEIFAAEDLLEAVYYITKKTDAKPCRIIICGSLHLARDVRKFLN
ncbi:MAG: bifunctional folylpolyglutamate synthase/dihydrofolate synthase [Proteobacteria bacterium]|nr:bifunctional folylpolyglutamate synthase/dihydrofolate synthase [Pseudomonadota bacterium]